MYTSHRYHCLYTENGPENENQYEEEAKFEDAANDIRDRCSDMLHRYQKLLVEESMVRIKKYHIKQEKENQYTHPHFCFYLIAKILFDYCFGCHFLPTTSSILSYTFDCCLSHRLSFTLSLLFVVLFICGILCFSDFFYSEL